MPFIPQLTGWFSPHLINRHPPFLLHSPNHSPRASRCMQAGPRCAPSSGCRWSSSTISAPHGTAPATTCLQVGCCCLDRTAYCCACCLLLVDARGTDSSVLAGLFVSVSRSCRARRRVRVPPGQLQEGGHARGPILVPTHCLPFACHAAAAHGGVCIFHLGSCKKVASLAAHSKNVRSLAYDATNNLLLTCRRDMCWLCCFDGLVVPAGLATMLPTTCCWRAGKCLIQDRRCLVGSMARMQPACWACISAWGGCTAPPPICCLPGTPLIHAPAHALPWPSPVFTSSFLNMFVLTLAAAQL